MPPFCPAAARALTYRQLADLFGVGAATVHRIPDRLTPPIAELHNLKIGAV